MIAEATRAARHKLSTMILIQQKAHGHLLRDMLLEAGVRARFIDGDNDQAERKQALSQLATGAIDVLIGSTILDVGVDVPAVGMVILGGGGKAEVALRQRIGRGLRAKKKGPNCAFILDFQDDFNTYLKSHAQQRRQIVTDTEGFGENVLPDEADFDYGIFSAATA